MRKIFWIPLLVVVVFLVAAGLLASGSDLLIYSDLASLAVSLLPVFFVLLPSYTPKEMGQAFRQAMEDTPYDKIEAEKALVFFETAQKILIVDSLIGFVIGVVALFQLNLQINGNANKIGFGIAVSLITILYSLVFILLVTLPFIAALHKKIRTHHK